ncbi:MAG: 1-deoxy-D-xylulose-5-phosphate synthase [Rhodocyclaceae bacterium]|jgi:1-deoxy-D-xylulose-5-phosphate synthase|nr:1-deoxy-D-xylulose-5-phosphate synthase [Rhodocyclaceae bacterium]MCA3020703.1 1-deoxy-D-xylulose-5-phosphate synthase [Rhodocyclaceae bacterium]MCA3026101.1 1-deoxy-D-xylulose-5-phosphate synthase [Rhodocyclaceae bacterium]MCA3027703.1 1-deoxy-D-xylulose-5-phosphate synthase [Rhodocyclaceae bacterium]MCA3033316.1 1-deoxy-D-xylulose-5-phosphate synthase [Rhodocyclaceae bacterium]
MATVSQPSAKQYPLLETIDEPRDLRKLDRRDLGRLANELRDFILHSVSTTGGHLSSNLGTVELTIALHYVFNTPEDRLVWDVGHQTYGHKILTGRRTLMSKLRQKGGIAGFPRREESPYDTFGTAHSSTSISAAIGMAVAARTAGIKRHAIAIIGDGAITAGMAFEAMNNVGKENVIVILNDNDMSISESIGALNNYFAKLMSGRFYATTKKTAEKALQYTPTFKEIAKKLEEHAKGMIIPSTMFEEFGFNYTGPIDGHNVDVLLDTLNNIKQLDGPQFLHVVTRKGQGYKLAEDDPINYHGPSKFDPKIGLVKTAAAPDAKPKPTYTQIFSDWLCDMARAEPTLIGITPAMREGSGLVRFSQEFPERYFDTAIAEQHAVTFAAGLAADGMRPVLAIYSTFLQRGYDQLIHDVALQNLPVVFALDRGGLVGADGPTHHGAFDLSYLRCIPNMVVMTPADENECRQMLTTGVKLNQPSAVRYPRGAGPGVAIDKTLTTLPVGKGVIVREAKGYAVGTQKVRVAMLAFGSMVKPSTDAAEELNATVANMRFVKPLDDELVFKLATTHDLIVTVEENVVMGGAGSAVAESLSAQNLTLPVLHLGLPDHFVEHGDPGVLLADCGLTRDGIVTSIKKWLAETGSTATSTRVAG